jgi:hypothetical protein
MISVAKRALILIVEDELLIRMNAVEMMPVLARLPVRTNQVRFGSQVRPGHLGQRGRSVGNSDVEKIQPNDAPLLAGAQRF